VTYPLDLVRRRIQVQAFMPGARQYGGMMDALRHIVREEGVRGLYKGMGACYLKVIPAMAISFAVNEQCRRWFGLSGGGSH